MLRANKMIFKNLKIRQKYFIAASIIIGLFLLSSIYVYTFLADIRSNMDILKKAIGYSETIAQITSEFLIKDSYIADYVAFETEDAEESITKQGKNITQQLDALKSSVDFPEALSQIKDIKLQDEEINKIISKDLKKAIENSDKEAIVNIRVKLSGMRFAVLKNLNMLNKNTFAPMQKKAESDMTKCIVKSIWVLIIAIMVSAVAGFILLAFISNIIQRNLNRVIWYSDQIADKKLYSHLDLSDSTDEIGTLGLSFTRMKDSLTAIIRLIYETSVQVGNLGNSVMENTEEACSSSRQVTSTMENLSQGTEDQAQSTVKITDSLRKFESNLEELSIQSNEQLSYFQELVQMSKKGQISLDKTLEQIEVIIEAVNSSVARMQQLDKNTGEIVSVVKIINSVAEQTNLLALNAAIEAARAGEAGKGFLVVANEIEKMAGQVKSSLGYINSINEQLRDSSSSTLNSLNGSKKSVEGSIIQIKNTEDIFSSIHSGVTLMLPKLQAMCEAIAEITDGSKSITSFTEEISSTSQEIAAGTQETTAIVETQQNSLVKNLTAIRDMMVKVETLEKLVSEFRLSEEENTISKENK